MRFADAIRRLRGLAAALCAAVVLTACQSNPGGIVNVDPNTPIQPGTIRISVRSPDPAKWTGRPTGPGKAIWACRELACPDRVVVASEHRRAPTSKPDPVALRKLAAAPATFSPAVAASEDGRPKVTSMTKLDGSVVQSKGYPAVHTAVLIKRSDGKTYYGVTHLIFAKMSLLKLEGVSSARSTAEKAVQDFVAASAITEGPEK